MIKFLRRNQQVFILFIFLYSAIAVFSILFLYPAAVYSQAPFKLPYLSDFASRWTQLDRTELLLSLFAFFLLIFAAFYLVRINISHMIIGHRSQFPAIFFISIVSFVFRYELFSPAIIALIFLLFAIDRILGSLNSQKLTYRFLDAGILIAIGSIFYINLIFFLPFLWVAQIILRAFNLREFLYTLIGLLLPFLYIFSASYFFDVEVSDTIEQIKGWIKMNRSFNYSLAFYGGIGYYLLVMIVAQFYAINKFTVSKVQTRKIFQIWFYLFINAVLIVLFIPSAGIEIIFFMAIPVSILLSIYFTDCRSSIFNRVMFILLIFAPLVVNIFL